MEDRKIKYYNEEWNFILSIPENWEVVFENNTQDLPWVQPVRLAGPQDSRTRPVITVVVQVIEDDGKDLATYMSKAEKDLSAAFSNFQMLSREEGTLQGWPMAKMKYTYGSGDKATTELNVTTFFGKGQLLWFQMLCETHQKSADQDIPVFEKIINSLRVDPFYTRLPHVELTGANSCGACGNTFPPEVKLSAMLDFKLGHLAKVCDSCWETKSKIIKTLLVDTVVVDDILNFKAAKTSLDQIRGSLGSGADYEFLVLCANTTTGLPSVYSNVPDLRKQTWQLLCSAHEMATNIALDPITPLPTIPPPKLDMVVATFLKECLHSALSRSQASTYNADAVEYTLKGLEELEKDSGDSSSIKLRNMVKNPPGGCLVTLMLFLAFFVLVVTR